MATLSIQDNSKLLPQLKSGFEKTICWNKYLAKPELLAQNANLNNLIKPSFQGINRLFVLAFENYAQRTSNKKFYISNVEIKDSNVMIDGTDFFDQPVKNDKVTYEDIRKVATGHGLVLCYKIPISKIIQNDCSRFKKTTSARWWLILQQT